MDVRTQTLKSARAIDAINGCVRLVAGKIDDEQGGIPYLPTYLAGESRRASTAAPHRAAPERMEQRPKYRFLGPYAAVRSMLVSAPCPVSARSAFQNTDDAREIRRASARSLVTVAVLVVIAAVVVVIVSRRAHVRTSRPCGSSYQRRRVCRCSQVNRGSDDSFPRALPRGRRCRGESCGSSRGTVFAPGKLAA